MPLRPSDIPPRERPAYDNGVASMGIGAIITVVVIAILIWIFG